MELGGMIADFRREHETRLYRFVDEQWVELPGYRSLRIDFPLSYQAGLHDIGDDEDRDDYTRPSWIGKAAGTMLGLIAAATLCGLLAAMTTGCAADKPTGYRFRGQCVTVSPGREICDGEMSPIYYDSNARGWR
jgi:hypothetical protein